MGYVPPPPPRADGSDLDELVRDTIRAVALRAVLVAAAAAAGLVLALRG